tara:strand:- start:4697 stop:5158 length:462 start_codon:yes stop_codon:yes gene_type:complete
MKQEVSKHEYINHLFPSLFLPQTPKKRAKNKTKIIYEWSVYPDDSEVIHYDDNKLDLIQADFNFSKNQELILRKHRVNISSGMPEHDPDDMIAFVDFKTQTFKSNVFSDGSKIPNRFDDILNCAVAKLNKEAVARLNKETLERQQERQEEINE